ncbi:MAG: PAS domain-containing protein, partial [Pseudobdellovibrionaceae bacterium]|nr:PAS domain-containing protein [Pseudobdellovibrionaceae bacterium]
MSPASDVLAVLDEAVLMVRLDQQGNVQHINNKFLRLLGLSPAEIMGKPYRLLIKPSQIASIMSYIEVSLKTSIPWQGELCHEAQNGLTVWTESTLIPGQNPFNQSPCYHIIAFDITERKAVEAAFYRSQMFWEKMMDFAPVGFFTANVSGACHYINHQWVAQSGLKMHQALGDGWLKAVHPTDRENLQNEWEAFVRGGASFQKEFRYQHQHGREVLVQTIAARIEGLNEINLIRVEQDITAVRDNE